LGGCWGHCLSRKEHLVLLSVGDFYFGERGFVGGGVDRAVDAEIGSDRSPWFVVVHAFCRASLACSDEGVWAYMGRVEIDRDPIDCGNANCRFLIADCRFLIAGF